MSNCDKFYKELVDIFSEEIRTENNNYQKVTHRYYEVYDLLKDKTIPFEEYINLQNELENLKNQQSIIQNQKNILEYSREIVFDIYNKMKRGKTE